MIWKLALEGASYEGLCDLNKRTLIAQSSRVDEEDKGCDVLAFSVISQPQHTVFNYSCHNAIMSDQQMR